MKNDNFNLDNGAEQNFFLANCNSQKYGEYSFLLVYLLSSFKNIRRLDNELIPMVEMFIAGKGIINDWSGFDWGGKVCFRLDHIMIIDESIYRIGRVFPEIEVDINSYDNPLYQEKNGWLDNTEYIEQNYSEFVKVPVLEFYKICDNWKRFLEHRRKNHLVEVTDL
jgi:hypothetical protein